MDLYIGERVKVTHVDNDILIGYISAINTNEADSVLVLHKVEIWPNGNSENKTRLPGVQRFQASEIQDIEILPESQQNNKTSKQSKRKDEQVVGHKGYKPKHLRNMVELDPEKLIFGKAKDSTITNTSSSTIIKPKLETDLIQSVFHGGKSSDYDSGSEVEDSFSTDEFTVLTKIDDLFFKSLKFILNHSVIGFATEGVNIGRDGKLCWIQIAVDGSVFLFDFIRLGDDGLQQGLKAIIESKLILKVVHDCRLVSDLLYHQFKVEMINIFDTQVAHVFAYQALNHKDLPRYVPGLASCLYEHLDLPNEQVHIMRIREQAKTEDQEMWAERPTPKWVLEAACKHVKHLMDLRMVLMEKMMAEFIAGVEIYLTYVRNSSNKEAKEYHNKSHLLPLAFQHLNRYVSNLQHRMQHNFKRSNNASRMKDPHGFIENKTRNMDPEIISSKDSPWHLKNPDKSVSSCQVLRNMYRSGKNLTKKQAVASQDNVSDNSTTKPVQSSCDDNNPSASTGCIDKSSSSLSSTESEMEENIRHMQDADFIKQLNSQTVNELPSQPNNVFKSMWKTEEGHGKSVTDSLKGISLIPAGITPHIIPVRKKSQTSHFTLNPEIFNHSNEVDLHDYGVIPTPKTLGRAHSMSLSPISAVTKPSNLPSGQNTVVNSPTSDPIQALRNPVHTQHTVNNPELSTSSDNQCGSVSDAHVATNRQKTFNDQFSFTNEKEYAMPNLMLASTSSVNNPGSRSVNSTSSSTSCLSERSVKPGKSLLELLQQLKNKTENKTG